MPATAGRKDFTDLQKEQMLRKILFEQLNHESINLNKYVFVNDTTGQESVQG